MATHIPTSSGTRLIKRFGHPSVAAADAAARQAGELLALAGADAANRAKIGDMIAAAKRGGMLPAVADVQRRLGLGLDPAAPGVTVAECVDGWLAGKARNKRASTVRGYESHIRVHIRPVIGDLSLERLNTVHIEAMLDVVPGSAGTRHRVLATLRAALNAAVRHARSHGTRPPASTWSPRNRPRRSAGPRLRPPGSSRTRRMTRWACCTGSWCCAAAAARNWPGSDGHTPTWTAGCSP